MAGGRWRGDGGGCLINQGIHTLDLLRWLGGPVEGNGLGQNDHGGA